MSVCAVGDGTVTCVCVRLLVRGLLASLKS